MYLLLLSAGWAVTYAEFGEFTYTESPYTQVRHTSPALSSSRHELENHIDPHSAHSCLELCVMSLRTWHNLPTVLKC